MWPEGGGIFATKYSRPESSQPSSIGRVLKTLTKYIVATPAKIVVNRGTVKGLHVGKSACTELSMA